MGRCGGGEGGERARARGRGGGKWAWNQPVSVPSVPSEKPTAIALPAVLLETAELSPAAAAAAAAADDDDLTVVLLQVAPQKSMLTLPAQHIQ